MNTLINMGYTNLILLGFYAISIPSIFIAVGIWLMRG